MLLVSVRALARSLSISSPVLRSEPSREEAQLLDLRLELGDRLFEVQELQRHRDSIEGLPLGIGPRTIAARLGPGRDRLRATLRGESASERVSSGGVREPNRAARLRESVRRAAVCEAQAVAADESRELVHQRPARPHRPGLVQGQRAARLAADVVQRDRAAAAAAGAQDVLEARRSAGRRRRPPAGGW